jgi:predicted permease
VLPLDFGGSRTTVTLEGDRSSDDEVNFNRVTPGYFAAMSLAAREGRVIDARDVQGAPLVAVVNETMARQFWPTGAVGQTFRISPTASFTVVGVVPDVTYRQLREDRGPSFYLAAAQAAPTPGAFHIRTAGPPDAVFESIRRTIASLDPLVPITRIRTLRAQADLNVSNERLALTIALWLSGAAVLLAAVGLYAAMSHAVSRRQREIGVRLALGAAPALVGRLVLREGLGLALAGAVGGLALAGWAGHLIRARLYGVSSWDPISLGGAVLLLGLVAIVAAWAPARRAARVDPVEALRAE